MAAPVYFSGKITFGELMVVVGAFYQVQQSLRWFVDNFSIIADWQATLLRVMGYYHALLEVDQLEMQGERITYLEPQPDRISIDNLAISLPNGSAELAEKKIEIVPGEHIRIVAKPGTGKSTLFRAFAGLWPWGKGTLGLPPRVDTIFLPEQPYVPPGSLRVALASPFAPGKFSDAEMTGALEKVGLGHRLQSLDRAARWERELSAPELKQLALARVLLHKPKWVFSDEAIDLIDKATVSVIRQNLGQTAIVATTADENADGFFGRTFHLIRPDTAAVSPAPAPTATVPALQA
jgi:putative ATP-binding cassette transporter